MIETLKPAASIDEYLEALSAPTEEEKMRRAIADMCSQCGGGILWDESVCDECPLKPWRPDPATVPSP